MGSGRLRLLAAALALSTLTACSLFRDGEERPLDAALNGDDGRLANLVESISAAAPPSQAAPEPVLDASLAPSTVPMTDPFAAPMVGRSVLFALHVASYRTESSAAAGWRILSAEAPETFDDLHPRIETVDLGAERGVYLRLKAGPLDSRAEAAARCAELVAAGHYCQTADFEGREIAG